VWYTFFNRIDLIHLMNMAHIDLGYDLLNYLVEQGFQPGERLPSIQELQDQEHLGVSASKIREQLEVARALGLVEVRSKTGTRLKGYSFAPAVRLSLLYALAMNPHHFELFGALRNHVEIAFWHEACALLTDEDGLMRKCIERAPC
jgi:DNA-binding FadR family transcriptional regulator